MDYKFLIFMSLITGSGLFITCLHHYLFKGENYEWTSKKPYKRDIPTPKKLIAPKEYWGKIGSVGQIGDFGYIRVYEEIDDEGNRLRWYSETEYERKFGDRKPDYHRDKAINMY